MTYTKNTWANGDVITAAKLNNMENGIEAADGSGLPAVTGADIGKSMVVQRGAASAGAVIVPQQTVSDEGEGTYPLSNVVTDLFTAGRFLQVTCGEKTEIGQVYADGGDAYCELSAFMIGYSSDAGGWYLWNYAEDPPAQLTISAAEVSNYAADWGKVYPYDLVIALTTGGGNAIDDVTAGEVISGSVDDVCLKLMENRPVSCIVILKDTGVVYAPFKIAGGSVGVNLSFLWGIRYVSGNTYPVDANIDIYKDNTVVGWWSE